MVGETGLVSARGDWRRGQTPDRYLRHPNRRTDDARAPGADPPRGSSLTREAEYRSVFRARMLILLAVLIPVGLTLIACGQPPVEPAPSRTSLTKGPIPDSARQPDGSIDMTQVPDFIPATDGDRMAGWIASVDALPPPGEAPPEIITVFGDDLATVKGHMHPGVGFVPLAAEAANFFLDSMQNGSITVRVRNDSGRRAILEITQARDEAHRVPGLVAPPIVVAAGEDRNVVLQAPLERWSLNLRGDRGFFYSGDLAEWARAPGVAMVVTEEGVLEVSGRP